MIQCYADLQANIADVINRQDMTSQIMDFIQMTHIKLSEYEPGLTPLVNPTDSNTLLQYNPYLYVWGAVTEFARYDRDQGLYEMYAPKFDSELANLAMTGVVTLQPQPSTFIPQPLTPMDYYSNSANSAANTVTVTISMVPTNGYIPPPL